MANHAQTADAAPAVHADAHTHPNYVKIWALLVVMLGISIAGPFFGMPWLTLVTAFGIAIVKAVMVAAYFMHLNIEKSLVRYLLLTILALVLVLWAGVYPDVQRSQGQNWQQERADAGARAGGAHGGAPAGQH